MSYLVTINGGGYNKAVSNLVLSTSTDTLGMQADFNLLYRTKEFAKAGDDVMIYKDNVRFTTMKVIDVKRDGRSARKITCFDYGFYLNENEVIIQFKNITAEQALKKLLDKFGISVRITTSLPHKITKIYKGEKVSDVIKDILEQCSLFDGNKYFFEMQDRTLVIGNIKDYEIKLPFEIILNPSVTESIKNLRNKITVVNDNSESIKVYTTISDTGSIKKYGMLQKVEQINSDEISKANKIAQELLKALNKIEVNGSFDTVVDNFDLRANRIITINEPITGLIGRYLIKSATHTIKKTSGKHVVAMEVGVL